MPKKATGSIFLGERIFFFKLGILRIWKYLFFWLFAPQPLPITAFGVHYRKVRKNPFRTKKSDMFVFEIFELHSVLLIDFFAKLAIFLHYLQIFFVFYFAAFSACYPDVILVSGWEFEEAFWKNYFLILWGEKLFFFLKKN